MPNGVLVQIGPLTVYWYSVLIVAGMLAAAWMAARQARRAGDDPDYVWAGLLACLVPGILGARLYHVASALPYYLEHPQEIFGLRMAGLGIYGAILGGALGLWAYTRWQKLSFLRWVDYAAPGVPLAQAIARWGNYFNQELYGYPTSLPWGIYIAPQNRLPGFEAFDRFHPTFLYESLWCLAVFAVLLLVSRRAAGRLRPGDLILGYGILYPLGRFFIEFQRPDAWKMGGVATAQWVAIAAVAVCGSLLIYRHQRQQEERPSQKESTAS